MAVPVLLFVWCVLSIVAAPVIGAAIALKDRDR
jgi:hypothetical protein